MAQKPSIPKGTRDFSPSEIARRTYIMDIIKKHFVLFGFQPIETPSFENFDTLMGKYGDEGDRLIFKILNSGDFISKVDDVTYSSKSSKSLTPKISDKALRYDLTVPFARYVVMHQNEIDFPFKRYQIQPVWRADRPQKGRFREFYQCDADVVGAQSLLQEIELIQLYNAIFHELKIGPVTLKLNHRKILSGIVETIGGSMRLSDFTVALDKLDKIGEQGVLEELRNKGLSEAAMEKAMPLLRLEGNNEERLDKLEFFLSSSEDGLYAVKELRKIISALNEIKFESLQIVIDVTLARGLNYYTGTIMEVAAPEGVAMGSIGGGGRYDDLTGIFGLKDVSGVGISFGLERIYLVMEDLNLFPKTLDNHLDVLCVNFGEFESMAALKLVNQLRAEGVKADIYPTSAKMQKQLKYANKRDVPFVILIGAEELANNTFVVKNMKKGDQNTFQMDQISAFLKVL